VSVSSAYSDSKLHNVILAFALPANGPNVLSNAVDPGWAATKMEGGVLPSASRKGRGRRSGWR